MPVRRQVHAPADPDIARRGLMSDLETDPDNLNHGTERGAGLIQYSLETYGIGRGILADKNGRIIAGNHTVESLAALGFDDVVFVPHDGRTLVVSQRMDLDLNEDSDATALAILDNQTSAANLRFDAAGLLDRVPNDLLARAFTGKEIETYAKAARPALTLLTDPHSGPRDAESDQAAPTPSLGRFPLAILLGAKDMQRWQAFKRRESLRTDTDAMLMILDMLFPEEAGIDDQEDTSD